MATAAQIAANRLNAMKSTGPRTEEGRAASRMNAFRHGVDALTIVIPGEDPEELADLSRSYRGHFRPGGPEQEYLVETLIRSDWLRRRYLRIEAEMLRHALSDGQATLGAIHLADDRTAHALERIRRHYEAAQRAWLAAHKQLQHLLIAEAEIAAALAAEPYPPPLPPRPEIGFVPQTGEATARTSDAQAPIREAPTPARSAAPNREAAAPNREAAAPNREAAAPNREKAAPSHEAAVPTRETGAPSCETAAPSREAAAPARSAAPAPAPEFSS